MKTLSRAFPLWLILGGTAWMLATATDGDMRRPLALGGLFLVLPAAVWLTAGAAAVLPARWLGRVAFWTVTVSGWFALVITAQGCGESHVDERQNLAIAFGIAGIVAVLLGIKARSFPTWRVIREAATGVAFLAILAGVLAWRYDVKTRSIRSQAEARWAEIGLPMAEFESTLAPSHENAGSEVVRQVLREAVSSRFYKDGSRAAEREPAIERSKATEDLIKRARDVLSEKRPPSDDLNVSSKFVAALEPLAPALDADYRRILTADPAVWASDPHDGYFMSVPNFLGVRMFSEVAAADATRRLSEGDQEGAARALDAGMRLREGLRQNPTLVSLMIDVAVEAMLAPKRVYLPASEDGLKSVARDAVSMREEFLRRLQTEGWDCLRLADQIAANQTAGESRVGFLSKWARQIVDRPWLLRQFAIAALNGAEHAAIQKSPATLSLPDLGMSLHEAVSEAHPSAMDANTVRCAMRIHATLLLREQTELLRDARARLAAGLAVESRDSVVIPGLRWELIADAEKQTVATRLIGVPEWITKNEVTRPEFWVLPLDGSVAWQFRLPARTAGRF
jgi:hypothetical protein